jgi:hypothetical protein
MRLFIFACALPALVTLGAASPAVADDFNFHGSLGPNGFTRYVPPLANPLFNETPYITTELRPIYLHNEIPTSFPTGGGHIDLGAAELRVALTERLGFIASKDGYVHATYNHTFPDEQGFANISLGLKYAVVSDPKSETILTIGAEYEPPSGGLAAGPISLQGGGSGLLDLFATGATTFGKLGLQGSFGTNQAMDRHHDTSMVHYSAHVDYEVFPGLFPLFEMNGFSVVQSAHRTPLNVEGVDLVNFGSTGGGTVVTAAFGARYKLTDHIRLGTGYERPVTNREDLLGGRVYVDLVLSY